MGESDSDIGSTERNTGYEFDLLDRDHADRDENGLMEDHMAQIGNFDTRHEALEMKVFIENRWEQYDYEIRAHETLWREAEEPAVCDYCGYEEPYRPLVRWTHVAGLDGRPGGAFCTTECFARWAREHGQEDLLRL